MSPLGPTMLKLCGKAKLTLLARGCLVCSMINPIYHKPDMSFQFQLSTVLYIRSLQHTAPTNIVLPFHTTLLFGITYEATSSVLMLKLANKGSDDEYSHGALTFPLSLHRTILIEGF